MVGDGLESGDFNLLAFYSKWLFVNLLFTIIEMPSSTNYGKNTNGLTGDCKGGVTGIILVVVLTSIS